MNQKSRYTDKINWTMILFFIAGAALIITGGYAHPQHCSAVVSTTFVLTGTFLVVSCIIAFLLE